MLLQSHSVRSLLRATARPRKVMLSSYNIREMAEQHIVEHANRDTLFARGISVEDALKEGVAKYTLYKYYIGNHCQAPELTKCSGHTSYGPGRRSIRTDGRMCNLEIKIQ